MNNPRSEEAPERGAAEEKKYWLDDPANVDKIWYGLIGVCALLFAADFFVEKHPYFELENAPNFYGVYGFVACFLLVIAAAQLRKVLMRDEDYYQRLDAEYEARAENERDEGSAH